MRLRRFLTLGALLLIFAACEGEAERPSPDTTGSQQMTTGPFRGIYTVIYRVPDLAAARAWYANAFGVEPYFDEPFYVGFNVGGYELGLQPEEGNDRAGPGGTVAYWGVPDADQAFDRLLGLGATPRDTVQDVGGGIRVATVNDPFGNVVGIIQNPQFGAGPR